MNDVITGIKNEADGFRYVYNNINNILIDNFFGEEKAKIVREIDLVNPGITNGCFACELYLKTLLMKQKKDIKETHNLYILFNSINGKTQNQIIKKFTDNGYTKELFTNKLKYIANGFKISRYDYENDYTYYMLSGFIYELIESLKENVEE
jgi:HEPN domain-containing protein